MRTEDIQYVLEVYKTQSISKAAENLNISSQGLGKAIGCFEKALNCTLFLRSSVGTIPTAVCERIIGDLSEILEKSEAIQEVVSDFSDTQAPPTYIIAMDSIMSSMVEEVVNEYNKSYNKNVHVINRSMGDEIGTEKEFEERQLDYRLCTQELIHHKQYQTFNISCLHFHPIVGKKCNLCHKPSITIEDFDGMTMLVGNKRPYTYHFINLCKKANIKVEMKETFDKLYISKMLSENPNYFFIGQRADINKMIKDPKRELMILKMDPPFETNIVLQSRSGNIDYRLLNAIRKSTVSFSERYLD